MKKLFGVLALISSLSLSASELLDYDLWAKDLQTMIELNGGLQESLEGSDVNKNLVRDDIENYVKSVYEDDEFQKIMFLEAARKIQQIITLPKSAPKSLHSKLDKQLLQIYTCRDFILYKFNDIDIEKELEKKREFKERVLNTQDRLDAYIQHKQLLSFKYNIPSDEELKKQKNSCEKLYSRVQKENKTNRTLTAK